MRLSNQEQHSIKHHAKKYFGSSVKIILFGSRIDDSKKGGDIDLLIDSKETDKLNVPNKIRFLTAVKSEIGDQRIDVLLTSISGKNIINTARENGIEL